MDNFWKQLTLHVSAWKKQNQHSCKASEFCLVTYIKAAPVGKQEWIETSLKIEALKGQTADYFFICQIWTLLSTE